MKISLKGKILLAASLAIFQFAGSANSANSAEVQVGDLTVSLPDTVKVTGSEIGLSERSCTIKVTIDVKAGETIPLKGGVNVTLYDSLNTIIDTGYSSAQVEGLVRQEFVAFFRCNNTNATLKPPYRFDVTTRDGNSWIPNIPVNLVFIPKVDTSTQTAKPEPSANVSTPNPPTPKPVVVSPPRSTITCMKGKLTKKVTAVKPKCPNGYKLKK